MTLEEVAAALDRRGVSLTGIEVVAETVDSLLRLGDEVSDFVAAEPEVFPLLVVANKELDVEQ